jgi:mannose/fructose/N-acetylgalactosamine-specific phosphotransferase system component IIB
VITLSRVDSRLIHGQVIEAWLPYLRVERVVVADDVAAHDELARAAYEMAVPPEVEVVLAAVDKLDFLALAQDSVRTLVLFRDVRSAVFARERGLPDGTLNLGNVHSGPGRVAVSRSVFLDDADKLALQHLADGGMSVQVQAVPGESPQLGTFQR